MKRIEVTELTENVFNAIGKEWMLVGAEDKERLNIMTASWGGLGWLWNKPVAFVFIRPERHTFGLIEQNKAFTLSFLGKDKQAREVYNLCGTTSGKDTDKVKACSLTTTKTQDKGTTLIEQARLTLVCKALYSTSLAANDFIEKELVEQWYGAHGGYHKMYVAEITDAYIHEA